jgi:hypothetical protein
MQALLGLLPAGDTCVAGYVLLQLGGPWVRPPLVALHQARRYGPHAVEEPQGLRNCHSGHLRHDPVLRDLVGVTAAGMPVPLSRNCCIPTSLARKRTARLRNARFALISRIIVGRTAITSSAATLSASKLSLPPSQ